MYTMSLYTYPSDRTGRTVPVCTGTIVLCQSVSQGWIIELGGTIIHPFAVSILPVLVPVGYSFFRPLFKFQTF